MKKFCMAIVTVLGVLLLSSAGYCDYEADKKTCVALCNAAAEMIENEGVASAICEINQKDGKFVNGQIYVFLETMDAVFLAHPMKQNLIGKNLSKLPFKDKNGRVFYNAFTDLARTKGSGWVDYMWPKPGEKTPSEKSTYILKVEGTDLIVGAGCYK